MEGCQSSLVFQLALLWYFILFFMMFLSIPSDFQEFTVGTLEFSWKNLSSDILYTDKYSHNILL